jgi:hypothetical protein
MKKMGKKFSKERSQFIVFDEPFTPNLGCEFDLNDMNRTMIME